MRIGIYVDVARHAELTGIGRHVIRLTQALGQVDADNEYYLYYPAPLLGRHQEYAYLPSRGRFRARPVRFPARWDLEHPRLWWEHYLPHVLRRDRVDVFHGPSHFVPRFDPARTVVTLHDLATFKMRVHGDSLDAVYRHWVRLALRWAGAVIALSEHTKRDVVELGVEPERVHVIYGGGNVTPDDEIPHHRAAELRARLRLPAQYILFVGTIQPRKNLPFLLRAFARLRREHPECPHGLVLAGPPGNASQEVEALARDLGIADRLCVAGYLEDWMLPLVYKMADLFVLPSSYEGFGMVIQEAMAYGVPVVATRSSSVLESAGDAALLVDVDDDRQLTDALFAGLTDAALRERLVRQGHEQIAPFTWERNARQTLALYQALYRGGFASARAPEGLSAATVL
jgi:glycosyltransferase involved in cell wall biosynthesis